MKKKLNIPGGLGIVGTDEYERNKKARKKPLENQISEYLKYLNSIKNPKHDVKPE